MAVRFTGPALSALYFELSHCQGDSEGLLLGKVISRVTDSISDSQINNSKEESTMYVSNYIHSTKLYSFYKTSGEINKGIRRLLSNHDPKQVVGWYRMRRQSSLSVSLRERAIHQNLESILGIDKDKFLFCLFTSSVVENKSTHSFDHRLFCSNDNSLKQVLMDHTV